MGGFSETFSHSGLRKTQFQNYCRCIGFKFFGFCSSKLLGKCFDCENHPCFFKPKSHMGVSKNRGTPKSSILIGFSIINHPFWGTPIFGNTYIVFFIAKSTRAWLALNLGMLRLKFRVFCCRKKKQTTFEAENHPRNFEKRNGKSYGCFSKIGVPPKWMVYN